MMREISQCYSPIYSYHYLFVKICSWGLQKPQAITPNSVFLLVLHPLPPNPHVRYEDAWGIFHSVPLRWETLNIGFYFEWERILAVKIPCPEINGGIFLHLVPSAQFVSVERNMVLRAATQIFQAPWQVGLTFLIRNLGSEISLVEVGGILEGFWGNTFWKKILNKKRKSTQPAHMLPSQSAE